MTLSALLLLACASPAERALSAVPADLPPLAEDPVETGELNVYWGRTLVEIHGGTDCAEVPGVLDALSWTRTSGEFLKVTWHVSGALAEGRLASKWAAQAGATRCGDVLIDGVKRLRDRESLYTGLMQDRTRWGHCQVHVEPRGGEVGVQLSCLEGREHLLEDLTLEVLLLENEALAPQANAAHWRSDSSWYRQGDPLVAFQHRFIPRRELTPPGGVAIDWADGLEQTFGFGTSADLCADPDACSLLMKLWGTKPRVGERQVHTSRIETLAGELVY